jgi:RNA-binding protein YhbY
MQDKEERDQIASTLSKSSESELVSVLGNMIILYKPKKDPAKRKFKLPKS